ncbi:2,4-dienoyl-CoA reductase [Jeotgalibacillus proteolyticus]|uniref:2,4-dienoyl-CoA reductase n=1 Tax=Jeotgalibacillus proteolyticus TaxID=2082395 RepID=UPI003CF7734D
MEKKVYIITGGSNGMGKYMAQRFVQDGHSVLITGRDQEKLTLAKSELASIGQGDIETFQMDVREPEMAAAMVKEAVHTFGKVDGLINNAAGNFICPVEKMSPNGWKSVIDIVLNGTFYCSKAAGDYWISNNSKGSMINMVATYAWDAGAGVAHSAAAKAGVLSLTKTLAVEWGHKYGIRTNAIAPGPIERTGGAEKLWQSEEAAKRTLASVPLKRLGKPEEIAGLAAYLFSEEAAYINGECITMDGGQHLNSFPF